MSTASGFLRPEAMACARRLKQTPLWTYWFEFLLLITNPAGDSPLNLQGSQ